MRVFWVILVLAVLGAGAWLLTPRRDSLVEAVRQQVEVESKQKEQAVQRELNLAVNEDAEAELQEQRADAELLRQKNEELERQLAALKAEAVKLSASTPPQKVEGMGDPGVTTTEPLSHGPEDTGATLPEPAQPETSEDAAKVTPAPGPAGPKLMLGEFEVIPATVTKAGDGTSVYDGKYPIKGDGSAENPYEISWDLLLSAEATFDPQNKRRAFPERVAMLDGKIVRIGGHIAFPLMVQQPRELLVMLNQWDGCCIGVPPTPYDAVEVQLSKAITGDGRFATMGTVKGRLSVKPYIVGDWLVGLYLMEQAEMSPNELGGEAGN